jgi:type I restriction enzyme S subunit
VSRIDALIRELCPSGVEFRPLGDLLSYEQPTKYLVSSAAYDDSFATPVLTAGKTFILGHTDEESGVYQASPIEPVVIFDDFTAASKWVDFPFKAKSSAMKMLKPKPGLGVDFRFLFFAMQTITYRPQQHARQWIQTYSAFRVPVPPIAVQREVVRVLDLFQALDEELKAERKARRIQFDYYRDHLLSFLGRGDVKRQPLSELGEFHRGRRFTKADYAPEGIPAIHYGEIYTHFGTAARSVLSHLRPDMKTALRFAQPGDVVIVDVGETVEDVGKAVAWNGDEPVAIHDHSYAFRHELNPTYVAYCMQTRDFRAARAKHVARTKINTLLIEGFGRLEIPVPTREEQDRIVAILNKFDALVNDHNVGLPAEIRLRRAQYEHYRDRLLTFQESLA